MGITKLMNIKSSPHGASRHLKHSIEYIMNLKKTADRALVGGNAGSTPQEVYDIMMETKADWEKTDGRQGYHFILSWKPGEISEEKAYEVVQEFCQEYLGDQYDYVFAVHNDQPHIHAHIVFNSVGRNTGYKYRYQKGDWERYIQPITDKIGERHGLSRLEYEKEKKKGKSYAEHLADKQGRYTWKKIIQADIDYMIERSESWNDFLEQMKEIGYTFPRSGYNEKGEYLTFCAPGNHRKRSDTLGSGYTVADIKKRILGEHIKPDIEAKRPPWIKQAKMKQVLPVIPALSGYQKRYIRGMYQAATYYAKQNPYRVNQGKVRRDMLQLEKLREDCRYILRQDIKSKEDVKEREKELRALEKFLKGQRGESMILKEDIVYQQYQALSEEASRLPDWDDRFENLLDQMEELEESLPQDFWKFRKNEAEIKEQLTAIRQERRILNHIKKVDQEAWKAAQFSPEKVKNKLKKGERVWTRKLDKTSASKSIK